jgi:hypothetical protein
MSVYSEAIAELNKYVTDPKQKAKIKQIIIDSIKQEGGEVPVEKADVVSLDEIYPAIIK